MLNMPRVRCIKSALLFAAFLVMVSAMTSQFVIADNLSSDILPSLQEAADESKRQGGVPVTLEHVWQKARQEAEQKLKTIE